MQPDPSQPPPSIPRDAADARSVSTTVTVANVLVVRQDLPEEFAYRLTELLFDAKPRLVDAHEEARRLDHRSAVGLAAGLSPG